MFKNNVLDENFHILSESLTEGERSSREKEVISVLLEPAL